MKPFEWNRPTDKLLYKDTPIDTQGRWVVAVSVAPLGDWVAVLSADGERRANFLIVFGGGNSFSGSFFHEIRRLSTGERVGTSVRLADSEGQSQLGSLWTYDESYTIYEDTRRGDVWIVPNAMVDAKEFGK